MSKRMKKGLRLVTVFKRSTSFLSIVAIIATLIFPASVGYADTASSTGVTIKVSDVSNQVIQPYTNNTGSSANTIIQPTRLAGNPQAIFSYNLNNVTMSKYSFVEASDTDTLPSFPADSDMIDLNLPAPNTEPAYVSDIGDPNCLTVKHYQYNGKQGGGIPREQSFGTPVSGDDTALVQTAATGTDMYETIGSNAFILDTKNSNTVYSTSYSSTYKNALKDPTTGKVTYYMKNAGMKAMKLWGYFHPTRTGSYLLGVYADDGAYGQISINHDNIVFANDWRIAAPNFRATPSGTSTDTAVSSKVHYKGVNLVAGNYYPIYMEWYEGQATQGSFVPQYIYNSQLNHDFVLGTDASSLFSNGSATVYQSQFTIPSSEFISSMSQTPASSSSAYFGDLSGISFPSKDGIYYVAVKFVSTEGTTQGLYGPFIVDNTKPELKNLSVTTNNANNKLAKAGDSLTISFKASETLKADPEVIISGTAITVNWTKDADNNYSTTLNTGSLKTLFGNYAYSLTDGVIDIKLDNFSDLSGNDGNPVEDKSVTYDTISPNVSLSYSLSPAVIGDEVITATYTEPLKDGEIPKISINQPGSSDISNQDMTMGANRSIWTYTYTVNADNGSTYKDGVAVVSLSNTHDAAGNISNTPTNSQFTIITKETTAIASYSYNPVRAYVSTDPTPVIEKITLTYNKELKVGQVPLLSIDQPGSVDISNKSMTMGADRSIWTCDYMVHPADGTNYKDGTAKISVTPVIDKDGNTASKLSNNTFVIDTTKPTVSISYERKYDNYVPGSAYRTGEVIIRANYSEPVMSGEIPKISINQPGLADVVNDAMVSDSVDGKVWQYSYTVHSNDGSNYIDGNATVTLSKVHDAAGNEAQSPANNSFVIDTTPPVPSIGDPVAVGKDYTMDITYSPSVSPDGDTTITLGLSDVELVKTGSANGIISLSGNSGNTRTVHISSITGIGTLGIHIKSGTAHDNAGNQALSSDGLSTDTGTTPLGPIEVTNYVTSVNFLAPNYLRVTNSVNLTATVEPAEANQAVVWSITSGNSAATVASDGTVTGISRGTVTVKAESVDVNAAGGKESDTKNITVIDPKISIPALSVSNSSPKVWSTKVELFKPAVTFTDMDESTATYTWSVADVKTGTIKTDSTGHTYLTGSKVGNVTVKLTVKAKSLDGVQMQSTQQITIPFSAGQVNVG